MLFFFSFKFRGSAFNIVVDLHNERTLFFPANYKLYRILPELWHRTFFQISSSAMKIDFSAGNRYAKRIALQKLKYYHFSEVGMVEPMPLKKVGDDNVK